GCAASCCSSFSCASSGAVRHLHSFPTRRSSDLFDAAAQQLVVQGARGVILHAVFDLALQQQAYPHAPGGGLQQRLAELAARKERSEEHTSELQSRENLVCRLLLEKKKVNPTTRA